MKKIILILIGILLFPVLQAAEKEKTWANLNETCFTGKAQIKNPVKGTIKIGTRFRSQLFFVQNKSVLPPKIFEYGKQKYLNYSILSISGVTASEAAKTRYLFDGNFKTVLKFDPYSKENPGIIIDAKRVLHAGSFALKLHYKGQVKVKYYVSKNAKKYIEVNRPQSYSWRYLKIRFETYKRKDPKKYPVSISELNILTQAPTTYLVNSASQLPISLFAGFECKDNDFGKLYNQTKAKVRKTRYSLNAATKKYTVNLKLNPKYNTDFDNDGILNHKDNCPFAANFNQQDKDQDLVGDVCDFDNETRNFHDKDRDHDGVGDSLDNCIYIYNPRQMDSNADKRGDLCSDDDNDGVIGHQDNCIHIPNNNQKDININGIGDACEFDKDSDGVFDSVDNCISIKNSNQSDKDKDNIGDACDNCSLYNPRQLDKNRNGKGDRCEEQEQYVQNNDKDADGVLDSNDNCKLIPNKNQKDKDKDGIGDVCDNCPQLQNSDQIDKDMNKIGDLCEDSDKDGVVGYRDNCMYHPNEKQADADNDEIGDVCEDDDHDGIVAFDDNCPYVYNKDQWDNDRDGLGDKCDDKDDRLLESNRWIVIGVIVFITIVFGIMIFIMIRKIAKDSPSQNSNKTEK